MGGEGGSDEYQPEPEQRGHHGAGPAAPPSALVVHVPAVLTVAAERATLRVDPQSDADRRRHLADLAHLRGTIRAAFAVSLVSGAMLFLADVEAFAASRIFWTKMLLVALLLANTLITARLDAALRRDGEPSSATAAGARRWRTRRAAAIASASLWFAVVLVGAALASH